jgi:predicted 2-oxoglutarate/Fe(II)-dependent dioxygenase YbiX
MTEAAVADQVRTEPQAETPAGPPPPRFAPPPGYGRLLPEWQGETFDDTPLVLHRTAGNPMILALLGPFARPEAQAAWAALRQAPAVISGAANLIGAATDAEGRAADAGQPNTAMARDADGQLSRLCGSLSEDGRVYLPRLILADAQLRVVTAFPITEATAAVAALERLAAESRALQAAQFAPVLVVPRVFEPELCRRLIEVYHEKGGEQSGFMRTVDGKTVAMHDPTHKRRRDADIDDPKLRQACQHRIHDRLAPMIERAFGWRPTRMERYIVARYAADEGGFFRRHRDNTTPGTAHRKFAVTINLNAEAFEGGELRFPEFGPRSYRAPTGGAVVFGCNLLHEALPVTKGERFAFLPFLYDDEGARIREKNAHLNADPLLQQYRA